MTSNSQCPKVPCIHNCITAFEILEWHSNRHAPQNTKERKMRSKIRWFTEFCNSHYLSHFAAFFIDARAKRSVVESCTLSFQGFSLKTYSLIPYTCSRVYKNVIDTQTDLKRSIHYITTNLSFPKCLQNMHRRKNEWNKQQQTCTCSFKPATALATHSPSIMILPQVHLRKPCYDFYFL